MLLEGLQLPVTTPFYPDGRVNLRKLEHNVSRYSKTPTAGFVVLSRFGEATSLSDVETRQVLRGAIDAAEREKVMLAGVSRDSVATTLGFADVAASLSYDALLVGMPSFLRMREGKAPRELLTYFQSVADRSALPLVLSDAGFGGDMIPAELIGELAAHPQIIGMVDSGSGPERVEQVLAATSTVKHAVEVTTVFRAVTARMRLEEGSSAYGIISAGMLTQGGSALAAPPGRARVRTRSKAVGFQILTGNASEMLDGLAAGAVGAAPGFAASAPQACYEVLAAWKDGDEGLAREKQARLRDVVARVEAQFGIAGIKFGCDLNGYFGGRPRLPLLALSGEERNEVERLMQGLKN